MAPTPPADPTTPVLTIGDVAHLGVTVCVFAHPDDEAYLAGGLMAVRRALARTRTAELEAALGILGVTEHEWLGYADQECAGIDPREPAAAVVRILDRVRPTTVVSFGPDGFTGHPDHRAVAAWTQRAVASCRTRPRLLHPVVTPGDLAAGRDVADAFDVFALGLPRVCRDDEVAVRLGLSGTLLDLKVAALRAHASQTAALVDAVGLERFTEWVRLETFADAADRGPGGERTPAPVAPVRAE
jgi:LmbE family N-acetylglucosaminyl deacetylase